MASSRICAGDWELGRCHVCDERCKISSARVGQKMEIVLFKMREINRDCRMLLVEKESEERQEK